MGFEGDSIHMSFVSGRIRDSSEVSRCGEKETETLCEAATFVKYRCVPPYTSLTEMTCEPAARD